MSDAQVRRAAVTGCQPRADVGEAGPAAGRALETLTGIGDLHAQLLRLDARADADEARSEEHTSELQSPVQLVCRLLLEKKNIEGRTVLLESAGSMRWEGLLRFMIEACAWPWRG